MRSFRDYQERIKLDRYAKKDATAEVSIGDLVIVAIKRKFTRDGEMVESREIGVVQDIEDNLSNTVYVVALKNKNKPQDKWEVVKNVERHQIDVLKEKTYEDICDRVATAVAGDNEFKKQVYDAMVQEKFVPAGRILAGLGQEGYDLTLFNCYVFSILQDSRKGIADHWFRIFDTFSRGGGIGWDLSVLRPRGSLVKKVSGRSSGAVTWGEQFSQITGTVEQGGSRRGASMQTLWCWHPDIEEFIHTKAERETFEIDGIPMSRSKELLKNSNVSVLISDSFMEAVEKDRDWHLVFPDLDDPEYDTVWNGHLKEWEDLGKKIITYKTLRARDLWNTILRHAWESGEPGILFLERSNKLSNSYYYSSISSSNPCAEQVLPADSVCNLAHINLPKFIKEDIEHYPEDSRTVQEALECIDFDMLKETTRMGVRFLDSITDLNKYHDASIKDRQESERRIGLGILGLGELLVRLGVRYGSETSGKVTEEIFKNISTYSYLASADLAEELGSFPLFDAEKILKSGFLSKHVEEVKAAIREKGLRNVTINTVAPTGSVGTMLGTTTGVEPYFLEEWTARSRIGFSEEEANVLSELKEKYGKDLPEYFVTTDNIKPKEHVRIIAAAQRWVDSSISKTVNLPNSATVEDVGEAYRELYRTGCKGGTVYRDGSRDKQVLYHAESKNGDFQVEVVDTYMSPHGGILRPKVKAGIGPIVSEETPVGTVHTSIRFHPETGEPYDIFITSGKGDVAADTQAISRLISIILRWPDGRAVPQATRLEIIRDQLHRIPGRGSVGIGPDLVISLPDGIAKTLQHYLAGDLPLSGIPLGRQEIVNIITAVKDEKLRTALLEILLPEESTEVKDGPTVEEREKEAELIKSSSGGLSFEICPECSSAGLLEVPGHCSHCVLCGHRYC